MLFDVLQRLEPLGLDSYYVGGGCICQTVWNYQNGLDLMHGIKDFDMIYFDEDTSYQKEDTIIKKIQTEFKHLPIEVDIKNQARVHLWYKDHYGCDITPYDSVESAINTWPTTASAVGVRMDGNQLVVYAPFGLNDMFEQIVRANKTQITEQIYSDKCEKWCAKWGTLKVIDW